MDSASDILAIVVLLILYLIVTDGVVIKIDGVRHHISFHEPTKEEKAKEK